MAPISVRQCALLTVLAASGVVALTPASSAAVAGAGEVTLTLGGSGKAARALAGAGVGVRPIAPAKKRRKRIALPVAGIAVGSSATVAARGGIRFKAGRRAAALRSIRLRLTAGRATVSAKTGGRRLVVLAAELPKGKARLDRADTTAAVAGAQLRLTAKAAAFLRAKLGVSAIRAGVLGQLAVDARPRRGGADTPGPGGAGGGSGPGSGAPRSGPIAEAEPPAPSRPATAVDVSGIAIAWYPRDSWIRYLTSGTGGQDGIFASGGATKQPPMATSDHPCSDVAYSGSGSFDYGFGYAPRSGWYDPPSQTAAIYGQGSVRFKWESHGIDLIASDPEIELSPSGSRAIFRFAGSGGTAYPNQRAALTSLDLAGQPTVVGNTRTYTAVRGRLTEDGQAVFAGFYPPPDDAFGCVTVSFTTS
jgi:Htaa